MNDTDVRSVGGDDKCKIKNVMLIFFGFRFSVIRLNRIDFILFFFFEIILSF